MKNMKLSDLGPDSVYWSDWIKELGHDHKSTWVADSKGGEPNCRREHENRAKG